MKLLKPRFWDKKEKTIWCFLLFPISFLFELSSTIKKKLVKKNSFTVPIICVGNIYLGGTGKTPLCIELLQSLQKIKNIKPVFIKKKYATHNDEVTLLKKFGKLFQGKNRVIAVNDAIKNGANLLILDDGFQDFSIKKKFSIICFNEKQWIGNGMVLPAGPLREKISALKRANCVVINGKKNYDIEQQILRQNQYIKIFYAQYKAMNIDFYKQKKIIAFAGIGNPRNFFDLLEGSKINVLKKISFPDHYDYTYNDLENLHKEAKNNNAILLTTEKDFLRIDEKRRSNIFTLKLKISIVDSQKLIDEIKKII